MALSTHEQRQRHNQVADFGLAEAIRTESTWADVGDVVCLYACI